MLGVGIVADAEEIPLLIAGRVEQSFRTEAVPRPAVKDVRASLLPTAKCIIGDGLSGQVNFVLGEFRLSMTGKHDEKATSIV
jgi:hypothetical protein